MQWGLRHAYICIDSAHTHKYTSTHMQCSTATCRHSFSYNIPPDAPSQTCKLTHLWRHIYLHMFTDMHTQKYTLPHLCKHTHSYIFIYMNTHRHAHSTLPACILPRACPFTHLYRTMHTYTCSHSCFTQDFWGCAPSSSQISGLWRSYAWHKCRRINTRNCTALHAGKFAGLFFQKGFPRA